MMYKVFNIKAILFWIAALFTIHLSSQTIQTFATAGTTNWTCPAGVTTIAVQCWGGGGGGGGAATVNDAAGGGGGGGAYASAVIAVTPGNVYPITVGAGGAFGAVTGGAGGVGGTSSFNSTVVRAVGGTGGGGGTTTVAGTVGTGGLLTSCTGTFRYSGGDGAVGNPLYFAGGGGSSAGSASSGNHAVGFIGGGAPIGGFAGGSTSNIAAGAVGTVGSSAGGGGAGGRRGSAGTNNAGGVGGVGQVKLSYCTAMTVTSTQTNVSCSGGSTGIIDASVTGGVPYSTASIVDQQQTEAGCLVAGTDNWQSFTPNVNGKFSSIDLLLGANTGNWYLYEGEGIAGALLSSGTYTCAAFSWFNIPIPNTPSLMLGQKYTFRLTTTSNTWQISCYGDVYLGGRDNNNYDRGFKTNMIPNPFSYLWSNGAVTEDISNLVAGTYTLSVTDAVGCSASKTTTIITSPTALAITSTQTNVTCFGGSNGFINATVTGGIQISQTAIVDQQQPNGGCGTTTGNFWQSFTPAISGQFSSIDVQILTNSANVGTWYLYSGAGQSGTILATGSYNIPTSGGTQWRTISIAGTPLLLAGQQYTFRMSSVDWSIACGGNVYAGGTNQSGNGDLVFRTYMIPNPYTYSWSNGAVTEDISNLLAGPYTVTVTDAVGCSALETKTITSLGPLAITASASATTICSGYTSTLTAFGPLTLDQYSNTGSTTGRWFGSNIGQQTFIAGYTGLLRKIRLQTATYSGASGNIVVNLYGGTYGSGTLLKTVTYTKPLGTNSWDDIIIPGGVNLTVGSPYYIEIPAGPQIDWIHSSSDTYVNGSGWWAGSNQTWDWNFETYMDLNTYVWNPGPLSNPVVSVSPSITTNYTVAVTSAQSCSNSQIVTVNVDPASVAGTASANQSICTGQVPSAITLTGFTGAIQWQSSPNNSTWTNITGATTNVLSSAQIGALSSTTYYRATVTSGLCAAALSNVIVITVNPFPTITATSSSTAICVGFTASLTGTGALSYIWNPGSLTGTLTSGVSNLNVSPPATTIYTLTGTSAAGCTNTQTVSLTVNNNPTVTATTSSSAICVGFTASLTATGASTYTWNPGPLTGSLVSVSPSATTIYTVTGTSAAGCIKTQTVSLSVNTNPTLTAVTSPTAICVGASANLTATGAATYTWNPGPFIGSLVSVNPSATTIYSVIGTSSVGCTNTQTVSLLVNPNLPLSTTISSSSTTICSGTSVSFFSTQTNAGSSPTYQWQLNGINIPGATFPTFTSNTLNNNDVISLKMTSSEVCAVNTPAFSNSITMTVNPNLPLSVSISSSTTTICQGTTLSFFSTETNAGTAPIYQWQLNGLDIPGATFPTFTSNTLNDYDAISLMMTANEVCTTNSPAYSNAIFITVNPNPLLSLSATSNTICEGATSSLNASGADSYTWTPGLVTGSIITVTPTINTTYIVEGENSSGCVASDSIFIVVNPLPIANAALPSSDSICYNGSVGLALNSQAGITSFSWTSSYGTTINTQNPTFSNVVNVGNVYYYGSVEDGNGCVSLVDTILVVVAPSLTLSALTSDVSCFGYSNGFIDLAVLGGFAPYSYSWSNSALTEDLSLLPAGNYSVTVNDASTCSASLSVNITQPTSLVANSVESSFIGCNGGNALVTVSATGGTGTYTGTGTFTVVAGSYTYTVTDANACTSITTITVSEPTQLVASVNITTPITCNGGNAILTLTATGGSGPYTGAGTYTVAAGNYTYTVTDANSCTSTTTISVTEPTLLVASSAISSAILCNGGSALIAVTATGGTVPYMGIGTYTVAAGNYTYTVTDANGCSIATTVNVTEPTPIVANVNIISPIACNGGNAILTVSASGGAGSYAGIGTYTVAAGNYTYTVTDANGCTSTTTISVTEPTLLVASSAISSAILCNGGSPIIAVTATGGIGPYTGAGTYTVAAGNYTYTVADANGCSSTTTISVTEPTLLVASSAISSAILCNGGSGIIAVTATGGTGLYSGTGTFTVAAGNYTYTVADANGCSSTTTMSVTQPTPIVANVSITAPISCNGGNAILMVTASGGAGSYAGTGTYTVAAGNYTYTVTDANSCSSSVTISVTEPTLLVASSVISSAILCNGGSAIIAVTATGGIGPYTGAGTYTVAAGNYTYTVADANGCSSTTTITVTEPTQIVATANITTPIACNGGNAILTVAATGGAGPYAGAGTFTVAAGNYTYTVADANGCSSTTTIAVTEPTQIVATANITTPIACNGGNAILTVAATGGTGPYTGTGTFTVAAGNYTYTVSDANGCSNTATIAVTEPASIAANVSVTTPISCNGDSAILAVTATGGAGLYAGTGTFIVSAGNYTFTVTDSNGCSSTTTISVTEPTPIVANVNITSPITCNGGNAILTVTATGGTVPYTGAGTFTVAAGNYTYTVTDANGCSSNTTISVTEPTPIVANVNITSPITCNGGNAILTVTATGGTVPYTGIGTFTVAAGNYTYTVTDANGCSNNATITVTQPSPIQLIASATNSIICLGQNTILNGTGVNTYTWSPGLLLGASVTVTPNASTTYTVNGTNGAGCLGTQTISINVNSLPVVNAGASQTICTGQSVTLTGTGSATSYIWNNGVVNNIAFTPTLSNSYIVVGTDVNSCSNTDTVEVIINPILSLSLSASTNSICVGNSVLLSANGATTYTWNPGLLSGASVTVNPTSNTTYSVNGDNGTGCVGTETISLLVQQLPNVLASASSTNICVGQTVSLTGSGATNYNWNNGVLDGIAFSPTTTTSYIVLGTDIFGCTATTTILVNVYSGTAAIPSVNPGIICIGDTSYLSVIGGSIPTWSLNSNPNLLNVAPMTDVSYTYSAVDNNGCIGDIIFNISIDEACAIKVYNGFTPNGDGINDFWIIDNIENYSTNKVYIYNRWGTLMYSTSNYNNFDNVWDGKFNGQAVTSGTYFYVIESNQLIKKGWIEITN